MKDFRISIRDLIACDNIAGNVICVIIIIRYCIRGQVWKKQN